MAKFYPQFILAMHTEGINGYMHSKVEGIVDTVLLDDFLSDNQDMVAIRQREHLDNGVSQSPEYKGDRNYRQLLPYRLLGWKTDGGTKLSVYRRTPGAGEERLSGKKSAGYGGHIDLVDVIHTNSIIDLKATIQRSSTRELDEEVRIYDKAKAKDEAIAAHMLPAPEFLGLIFDESDSVGHLHLGILEIQWLKEDQSVMAIKEDGLEDLETFSVDALLADDNVENWTRLAAQYLKYRELSKEPLHA